MAGVDALLSCLCLEQYRAALEDAVRAAPRHAPPRRAPAIPRCLTTPLPHHPAALLPRYLTATLLLTHPPFAYPSIYPSILSIYMQGYDDAHYLVVRMGAAELDELAAAASTAPCQTPRAEPPPRALDLARPTLHHSSPARPARPAPGLRQTGQAQGAPPPVTDPPPPNGRDGRWKMQYRCRCKMVSGVGAGRPHLPCLPALFRHAGMKPGHAAKLKWEVLRCRGGDAGA